MRRTRGILALLVVPVLFLALLGGIAPQRAAAQLPSADLAILRLTGPHNARVGHVVTFKVLATNLGPATSELDVFVTFSAGLQLTGMTCDLGISPDTPACEYSNVAPGTRLATLVDLGVLSGAGPTETATFCTNNEGQTEDPNSSNDCVTQTIGIV
jgi:uncharacterized repeat protein (TIGR01451 family)